jgi:hypothetical protein
MANVYSIATKAEETFYLDAAELSGIIKRDLKAAFPAVKFSVRCKKYSMGSSVSIHWTDGPLTADVDAVVAPYCAQGFDGMTDSTTNSGPVRLADGRLARIHSWISTSRTISPELHARVAGWFDRHFSGGWDGGNYSKEQEIHRASWRSQVVNGCLVVRRA